MVFTQQLVLSALFADGGQRLQRHYLPVGINDGKLPHVPFVRTKRVRVSHPDGNQAVVLPVVGWRIAQQPVTHLLRYLLYRHAGVRRQHRINIHHQFRIPSLRSFVIHYSADLFQFRPQFVGDPVQFVSIAAEDFHFHRLGRAFHIAQHVLKDLDELNLHSRNALGDVRPQIAHHLFDASPPLPLGFELHQDVALVLLRREESQLRPGAPRERRLFRLLVDFRLHLPNECVGFAQRSSRRGQVIDHEAALIHLRQKSGAQIEIHKQRGERQYQGSAAHPRLVGEGPADAAFVGAMHRLYKPL